MNTALQNTNIKPQRLPASIVIIVLASLILKMLLLQWNRGEYTDGIIQLQLWDSLIVFFPPGYSALVYLMSFAVPDLVLAGRAVSILASVATLIVFFMLARDLLDNVRQAEWATLLLALSPVFNRWSIRVMTDSLFCLGFVLCTYMLMLLLNGKSKRLCYLIGLVGLFSLVRYQAFFFIPFIAYMLYKKRDLWKQTTALGTIKSTVIALSPWLILIWWIFYRGFGHQEQFAERASNGFMQTLIGYWSMFETFVLYYPWAVTYSVFVCGVVGISAFCYGNSAQKRFVQFFGIAAIVFLIVQSAFLSFQYRYLLPLIPLWCLLAGSGICRITEFIQHSSWRWMVYGIVVCNLILMTSAVLYFQRAAFADLVDSALFLQDNYKDARVFSDETYGSHADNIKMKYWSGREILPLDKHLNDLLAGDLIVLHNAYTPLENLPSLPYLSMEKLKKMLQEKFDIVQINQWSAANSPEKYSIFPLLPDIMVHPSEIPLTSNPECMAFRFYRQQYYSVLIRLNEKK